VLFSSKNYNGIIFRAIHFRQDQSQAGSQFTLQAFCIYQHPQQKETKWQIIQNTNKDNQPDNKYRVVRDECRHSYLIKLAREGTRCEVCARQVRSKSS
jgi:hypothetical protein